MVKAYALIPKRRDVSEQFFHDHWAGPHAELTKRVKTIRRHVQSHRIGIDVPVLPAADYEGVAEAWFEDAATAAGMGQDPAYAGYARVDEPSFIDVDRLRRMTGTEHRLDAEPDRAPRAGVKTMLLLRRSARIGPAEFRERLLGSERVGAAAVSASITCALSGSYRDGLEPPFDAVAEFGSRNEGELVGCSADLQRLVDVELADSIDHGASRSLVVRELRVI